MAASGPESCLWPSLRISDRSDTAVVTVDSLSKSALRLHVEANAFLLRGMDRSLVPHIQDHHHSSSDDMQEEPGDLEMGGDDGM